nr:hypothetical protein CFP56_04095 [Quercus suber]
MRRWGRWHFSGSKSLATLRAYEGAIRSKRLPGTIIGHVTASLRALADEAVFPASSGMLPHLTLRSRNSDPTSRKQGVDDVEHCLTVATTCTTTVPIPARRRNRTTTGQSGFGVATLATLAQLSFLELNVFRLLPIDPQGQIRRRVCSQCESGMAGGQANDGRCPLNKRPYPPSPSRVDGCSHSAITQRGNDLHGSPMPALQATAPGGRCSRHLLFGVDEIVKIDGRPNVPAYHTLWKCGYALYICAAAECRVKPYALHFCLFPSCKPNHKAQSSIPVSSIFMPSRLQLKCVGMDDSKTSFEKSATGTPADVHHKRQKSKGQRDADPFLNLPDDPVELPQAFAVSENEGPGERHSDSLLADRERRASQHGSKGSVFSRWSWRGPEPYQTFTMMPVEQHGATRDSKLAFDPPTRAPSFHGWYTRKKHRAMARLEISDAVEMRSRVIVSLLGWTALAVLAFIYAGRTCLHYLRRKTVATINSKKAIQLYPTTSRRPRMIRSDSSGTLPVSPS